MLPCAEARETRYIGLTAVLTTLSYEYPVGVISTVGGGNSFGYGDTTRA